MGKTKIAFIILCSILIASCESNTYEEVAGQTTNPTYEANIKPIMTASCTSCHSGDSQFPNLETYSAVKNACLNNNLVCRIESNDCGTRMPLGGKLPQPNIDVIKLWVSNGFVEK